MTISSVKIKLLADFIFLFIFFFYWLTLNRVHAVYDFVYGSDRKFSDFPYQFSMSRNLGLVEGGSGRILGEGSSGRIWGGVRRGRKLQTSLYDMQLPSDQRANSSNKKQRYNS